MHLYYLPIPIPIGRQCTNTLADNIHLFNNTTHHPVFDKNNQAVKQQPGDNLTNIKFNNACMVPWTSCWCIDLLPYNGPHFLYS